MALALLLGCDYCPGGVPGVGKKIALQLIRGWKKHGSSYCILQRFRQWALDDFKAGMLVQKDIVIGMDSIEVIMGEYKHNIR